MAQYIDKDRVVEEVKRHIYIAESQLALFGNEDERNRIMWAQQKKVCEIILSFINNFKVKEVDLEKEIETHLKDCLNVKFPTTNIELIKKDVTYTAKKFFELGIKSRKGE